MGLFDKAKDLAAKHSDKVDQAIDKAGDLVDGRTGGQHADKVDQGQDFLKGRLDQTQPGSEKGPDPV